LILKIRNVKTHEVKIHYHPDLTDGVDASAAHAKFGDGSNHAKVTDGQLTEWRVSTLADIKALTWTKGPTGKWIYHLPAV